MQAVEVIMAVDPGPAESGWCIFDGGRVLESGVMANPELLSRLQVAQSWDQGCRLAVEMIASYGMPVGREVFETCVWIGRFIQSWHAPDQADLVYRRDVKLLLCGTSKAKDANVRQAIIDQFPRAGGGKVPQVGTKAAPGPLYGVTSHAWAALAVAITARHRRMLARRQQQPATLDFQQPDLLGAL